MCQSPMSINTCLVFSVVTWIQKGLTERWLRYLAGDVFKWCPCFWLLLAILSVVDLFKLLRQSRGEQQARVKRRSRRDWSNHRAAEEVCRHRAAWVAHRDVPYACGAVTRQKWEVFHHRTSHHCPFVWVTVDLVNKSNKLSLCNKSSKGRLAFISVPKCSSFSVVFTTHRLFIKAIIWVFLTQIQPSAWIHLY